MRAARKLLPYRQPARGAAARSASLELWKDVNDRHQETRCCQGNLVRRYFYDFAERIFSSSESDKVVR